MTSAFSAFSVNLIELGHFAAYLAFGIALVQGLAPFLARSLGLPALRQLAARAALAVFALTTVGGLILVHAFVTSNFSVLYVAMNSNTALPLFYKVTALWGGHEGSLYLWVWVLTLFTAVVAWRGRRHYPDRLPVILAVQGLLVVGFFGLILFLSNPFLRVFPAPLEGQDLNPLLQDPGMVFHPPMLYLGYVGFSVPFAFAMAALLTRWNSELWVGHIRRWALIAWGFLSTGILLGAWWAYYELGWGGYWAWDPVENASFIPWLVGTALIHSITVQERRRMLHTWNIFLVIFAFSLSLLGTFLVRSGVLSSVHSFAVDPGRGAYILAFMVTVLVAAFGIFLAKGRYQQAEESIDSSLSRESFFVWNNVLFTVAAACVLLGTLYPLALEALTAAKITVGAPYFNAVMVPLFLLIALLMGIAPLVPWRRTNVLKLRARLMWPALIGIAAGVVLAIAAWPVHWTGLAGVAILTFVLGTIGGDFARAVATRRKQRADENVLVASVRTALGNRRYYGGMLVHVGIVVLGIGLIGSGLFKLEKSVIMAPGDIVAIGGEQLRFDGVTTLQRHNYVALQAQLTQLDGGEVLTPERRRYPVQESPTTEASIHSTPLRDLYVVIADGGGDGTRWPIHIYYNPLVQFIWYGGLLAIFGLGMTLSFPVRRAARARAASPTLGAETSEVK